MSELLEAWRGRGQMLDVFGRRVFVVDTEGKGGAPPLLVLHGFPTSTLDYLDVLQMLAADRRVVLFDFLGFGLSEKRAEDAYSLIEQAEVAIGVWRQLGIERGHLLAHDYGTSVATELLARRERDLLPLQVETLTMCNGSMHIELAHLSAAQLVLRNERAGPLLARLSNRAFFGNRLKKIFGRPDAVSETHLDLLWAGVRHDDGHLRLPAISQYLHERRRFWHRWIGALTRFDRPTHVVWGKRDPIAVPAIAEQLEREIVGARLTWLDDLGHFPMMEDPAAWAGPINAFLRERDQLSS